MIRMLYVCLFVLMAPNIVAQKLNKHINKDSLFKALIKPFPANKQKELQAVYKEGSETEREFLLFMLYMPRSSKKELIENIDTNFPNIERLKKEYEQLVPQGYTVSIEIEPADTVFEKKETINIKGFKKEGIATTPLFAEWDVKNDDKKLDTILNILSWNSSTLSKIKVLLANAKCVSIENGPITTIGFARSGMGMYKYKLFDHDLTSEEIKHYNTGCTYIYHRKNMVLEYGSGAIGPTCFPD